MEINETKLRDFIDQRRTALEEQLRQFEASFAMFEQRRLWHSQCALCEDGDETF